MVHSEADYEMAVEASGILFGSSTSDILRKLDEETLLSVFDGIPRFEIPVSILAGGAKAIELFTDRAAVFPSKGEMRKMVQSGGVSINKERLTDSEAIINSSFLLNDKYILVQKGKKNYYLLIAK